MYGIGLEVYGDFACFTRPEYSERVSASVITPSAARGIFKALYWHPQIDIIIDEITVLSPIKFVSVRKNELKVSNATRQEYNNIKKAIFNGQPMPHILTGTDNQSTILSTLLLEKPHYLLKAHFECLDKYKNDEQLYIPKALRIFKDRLAKGKCVYQPYFGMKEFVAYFKPIDDNKTYHGAYDNVEYNDLGINLYNMDYSDTDNVRPTFYHPIMKYGVINVRGSEKFV